MCLIKFNNVRKAIKAGPGRAGGAGELGCHPRGVRVPGLPRCGTLGAAALQGPDRISGWGGQNGSALGDAPETPREVSRVPGAAEERAGPGQDRTLSLRCG